MSHLIDKIVINITVSWALTAAFHLNAKLNINKVIDKNRILLQAQFHLCRKADFLWL